MKRKMEKQVLVFIMTLLTVLVVGIAVLTGIRYLQNREYGEQSAEASLQITDDSVSGNEKEAIDKNKIINETVESEAMGNEDGDNINLQAGEAAAHEEKYADILTDPESMKKEKIYAKEGASSDEAVLAFGGDVCFDENYSNMYYLSQRGGDISKCLSEDLYQEITKADIFMVNNEFTYTKRGEAIPEKAFTFRSDPKNVSLLKDMGVDVVSLANNHVFDYGEVSLTDTLETLEEVDMPYVGAGRNLDEAGKPVYFIINDMKIAIVAASQIERLENPDTRGATETNPGVFRCWDNELEHLLNVIREAKEKSDFVVVYIHWGTENTDELDWAQTYQAPKIAEAGADVIIGGHTHCLQGIDVVENVPVIYSIGNFWFNSKNLDSCIVKLTVDKQGLKSFEFLPARTESCTTHFATGTEKVRILEYMRGLSPNVTIDESGLVTW